MNHEHSFHQDIPADACERCGKSAARHDAGICQSADEFYALLRDGRAWSNALGLRRALDDLRVATEPHGPGRVVDVELLRDRVTNLATFRAACDKVGEIYASQIQAAYYNASWLKTTTPWFYGVGTAPISTKALENGKVFTKVHAPNSAWWKGDVPVVAPAVARVEACALRRPELRYSHSDGVWFDYLSGADAHRGAHRKTHTLVLDMVAVDGEPRQVSL